MSVADKRKLRPLTHVSILASAGSGKTFQLTNRYIQILARGAAPSSILASTFTRAAAGEIDPHRRRPSLGRLEDERERIVHERGQVAEERDTAGQLARRRDHE